MTATQERPPTPPVAPVQPRRRRKLPFPLDLYQSAVGKKWVMALSGIALLGFVAAHMVGNLKMYLGAEDYDEYAEFLRELGHPILPDEVALWIMRVGLLVAFGLHIHAAVTLTRMNQRARPQKYHERHYVAVDFAGQTMRWTGIWVALFLIWHLLDLTLGVANPEFESGEVYANVVASFERPAVAAFYILANIALGIHIFHGAWSIFQSLGINNPRFNGARRGFAVGFAALVAGANITFPVAVLAGVVGTN